MAIAAAVATAGQSLLVPSDGFPFEPEVALKRAAHETGALVMGPDSRTEIVSGLALGFTNVVRARRVGLVAVSGTGASFATPLGPAGMTPGPTPAASAQLHRTSRPAGARACAQATGGRAHRAAARSRGGRDRVTLVTPPACCECGTVCDGARREPQGPRPATRIRTASSHASWIARPDQDRR